MSMREKITAFRDRLPVDLTGKSKGVLIKEFIVNHRDFSNAVKSAVQLGREQEKEKMK